MISSSFGGSYGSDVSAVWALLLRIALKMIAERIA